MQVESEGGSKYTLTFTDDYSQYTTVYFIKSKSEVLLKFQKYVNSVEKHTGHQISFIKRYMGSSTSTWRKEHCGILLDLESQAWSMMKMVV